jgi:hypothetical protein
MGALTDVQVAIDQVKAKSTKMTWIAGILGVIVLAPLTWILAYGLLGLAAAGAALALAGIVGATIWFGAEPLIMRLQNKRIEAIVNEAMKNPIPTLWNEHKKDQQELDELAQAIADYSTEIMNFDSKMKKLSVDMTEADAESFKSELDMMHQDLRLQEEDLRELRKSHMAQEVEIKRASAIWEAGEAMAKANAKNARAQREDTLSKIKKDTALDSVTRNLNRGKAQLRSRIEARRHSGDVEQIPMGSDTYLIPMQTKDKVRA